MKINLRKFFLGCRYLIDEELCAFFNDETLDVETSARVLMEIMHIESTPKSQQTLLQMLTSPILRIHKKTTTTTSTNKQNNVRRELFKDEKKQSLAQQNAGFSFIVEIPEKPYIIKDGKLMEANDADEWLVN